MTCGEGERRLHRGARPAGLGRQRDHLGIFNIPETRLDILGDVCGLDVVELGYGTACFSAWLARRGARPVGVDLTSAQLATARRCQERFGLFFPLIEADAGHIPFAGGRFDLVISECGASLWCDPARWIPEAARILRPGGWSSLPPPPWSPCASQP